MNNTQPFVSIHTLTPLVSQNNKEDANGTTKYSILAARSQVFKARCEVLQDDQEQRKQQDCVQFKIFQNKKQ